ncbi:hypothetical protein [Falsirhodobacter sp. 20TX0035]|uniref:hypothetical protein n=1 Tax=Falsirhodobacter sp. 20TX0035 TaxID=3022019 RepID=UPI00232C1E1F|nr:hypothetical protein [Falsirhodobacter sp. 20TX0035]MDB6455043.1 hypothetical protein [Falsirhodobacter sp. 20TX0035]
MNITLKQGNTAPALRHKLEVAGDLAGASAVFTMTHNDRVIVNRAEATIEDGHAVYQWQAGDTGVSGVMRGEFTILYADGTSETDPESGYIQITIERGLQSASGTAPVPTYPGSGEAGRGIASTSYDPDTGIVTFAYTDNTMSRTGDLRGAPGAAGSAGPQGVPGPKGDVGAQGPQGEKGDAGDVGPTGSRGPKGDAGATGAVGPKGDAGATGDVGPVGPKGDSGATGLKGDTGATGPKGDTGATGAAGASVTITTVTTQAAYDAAVPGPTELIVRV